MKKICHLTSNHTNNDGRIFKKQCLTLSQNGYDVWLIAQGNSGVKDGVNIIGHKKSKNKFVNIIIKPIRIYQLAMRVDADIYFIHDPALLLVALIFKLKGKKVVFDSHENYTELILIKEYIPKSLRLFISKIYYIFETFVCRRIDAVIFPCPKKGRHIFEERSKRFIYLNNVPLIEEINIKSTMQKNMNTVCYVGALTRDRGIFNLIKSCYKSNVRLILAGDFYPEKFKEECLNLIEYQCVDYRGFCTREEVLKIYDESQTGISVLLNCGQYNKYDNFPTKVYEYMARRLPVIISKSDYVDNILSKFEFGISVDPDNIEEISKAINVLISNPDIAKKMGANGEKLIVTSLNWNMERENLEDLIATL